MALKLQQEERLTYTYSLCSLVIGLRQHAFGLREVPASCLKAVGSCNVRTDQAAVQKLFEKMDRGSDGNSAEALCENALRQDLHP